MKFTKYPEWNHHVPDNHSKSGDNLAPDDHATLDQFAPEDHLTLDDHPTPDEQPLHMSQIFLSDWLILLYIFFLFSCIVASNRWSMKVTRFHINFLSQALCGVCCGKAGGKENCYRWQRLFFFFVNAHRGWLCMYEGYGVSKKIIFADGGLILTFWSDRGGCRHVNKISLGLYLSFMNTILYFVYYSKFI